MQAREPTLLHSFLGDPRRPRLGSGGLTARSAPVLSAITEAGGATTRGPSVQFVTITGGKQPRLEGPRRAWGPPAARLSRDPRASTPSPIALRRSFPDNLDFALLVDDGSCAGDKYYLVGASRYRFSAILLLGTNEISTTSPGSKGVSSAASIRLSVSLVPRTIRTVGLPALLSGNCERIVVV